MNQVQIRQCRRKAGSSISPLVNARELQLECLELHETLLVPLLMYGIGTMEGEGEV